MSNNRVEVDHDVCAGYAECTRIAADAFRLNDANQSEYTADEGVSDELLLVAAEECPTNAIRILAPDGGIVYESA